MYVWAWAALSVCLCLSGQQREMQLRACHNRGTWSADLGGTSRHWALDGCLTTREQTDREDRTGPRERTFPCEEYDGMGMGGWVDVDGHDGCRRLVRADRDAGALD